MIDRILCFTFFSLLSRLYKISVFSRGSYGGRSFKGKIIGCALKVHKALGSGFLASVYERALQHELLKAGLVVECQRPLQVHYD
jgi:hypothetical protein